MMMTRLTRPQQDHATDQDSATSTHAPTPATSLSASIRQHPLPPDITTRTTTTQMWLPMRAHSSDDAGPPRKAALRYHKPRRASSSLKQRGQYGALPTTDLDKATTSSSSRVASSALVALWHRLCRATVVANQALASCWRYRDETPAETVSRQDREARDRFARAGRPASRILLRDAYDHQSIGRWNIKRVGGSWVSMYLDDWFNTVVHLPFARLLILMAMFYICLVSLFAVAYLSFADECGMDFSDVIEAYYFSLETMATIGYGTKDYFFGHCWEPLVLINLQVTASLVVESLYFGIIFHRLTRGRKRTNTVLFSDKAVVRRVADAYYLIFQVCEMRRHHLLDAHVRLFAVRHERDPQGGTAYYQAHRMALKRPNDAAGGMLLMALPQLVVHKLDASSPLMPPTTWMSETGPRHWPGLASFGDPTSPPSTASGSRFLRNSSVAQPPRPPPLHQRKPSGGAIMNFVPYHPAQANATDAAASKYNSGHSHTSYDSADEETHKGGFKKRKHATPSALDDAVGKALEGSEVMSSPEPSPRFENRQFLDDNFAGRRDDRAPTSRTDAHDADPEADLLRRNMHDFFRDREIEVIAIVEGNDEYTSRLVQARHSYAISDVAWWRNFAPCVFRQAHGSCVVDFSQFHRTVRNPPPAPSRLLHPPNF